MAIVVYMKQGDQLPALKLRLSNRDNTIMVMPLGTTAKFKLVRRGVVILAAADAYVDVAQGTVTYEFASTDLEQLGEYLGEFTLTFPPSNKVLRLPKEDFVRIRVAPKL